jgi:cardiolipin synthase
MNIFTIPNFITFLRLLMIIPFVLFLDQQKPIQALMLLAFIALLDGLDGFIARHAQQQSSFGELFDSSSDLTILVIAFLASGYYGFIPKEWHVLLVIITAFLLTSKCFHIHMTRKASSTIPGKITAVLAYTTVGASLVLLSLLPFILGMFVASSLYTSVSFFLNAFHRRSS